MSRKLIITQATWINSGRLVSVWYEDNKEIKIDSYDPNAALEIGNIYVGRVSKVVANINAAFVDVAPGMSCYYSLTDNKTPIFLNRKNIQKVCEGDLLLVQITKEAIKTKAPVCSSNINLTGRYVVLTTDAGSFGISRKITDRKWADEIEEILRPHIGDDYGVVVRTDAYAATTSDVEDELRSLVKEYEQIMRIAATRSAFTVMKKADSMLYRDILAMHPTTEDEIVTDDEAVYEEMQGYKLSCPIRLYNDKLLPLYKNYDVCGAIEKALDKRVWLKNGGFLIIEPTEALTVIDVNTGKFSGNEKECEDTFLKMNLLACKEIARQLILRNISGIVIVDFISMKSKEAQAQVSDCMVKELAKDPVKATFVDYTRLGLMEITRKKIKAPLYEEKLLTIK